jgi:hypothetical protein
MFSDRLRKRMRLWWGRPRGGQTPLDHLRRLEMLLTRIPADAPESRWRRGEHWPRRLANKLNARALASRLGCAVPAGYWDGRLLTRRALAALPERFVLKPAVGTRHQGAYVMAGARELLTGATLTRAELFERVRAERGRLAHVPLLAEELVTNERGEHALAVDYKVHVFGDEIGAIQVIHRSSGPDTPAVHRFYTPDWRPFDDPMTTILPTGPPSAPPACLAELCEAARTLGSFFPSYVRVDLYATRVGCVFGEFSFTPANGEHFTPFADAYFEALWRDHFPDAV